MIDFPKARFIATNGIQIAVHEAGKGLPIILCHSFPEIAFSWCFQVDPLVHAFERSGSTVRSTGTSTLHETGKSSDRYPNTFLNRR